MPGHALFAGLVVDENDRVVGTAIVGDEPFYIVDDAGFRRHIPARDVDRQVLGHFQELMKGSEGYVSEQAAKMLGQEDIFTRPPLRISLRTWINSSMLSCSRKSPRKAAPIWECLVSK